MGGQNKKYSCVILHTARASLNNRALQLYFRIYKNLQSSLEYKKMPFEIYGEIYIT